MIFLGNICVIREYVRRAVGLLGCAAIAVVVLAACQGKDAGVRGKEQSEATVKPGDQGAGGAEAAKEKAPADNRYLTVSVYLTTFDNEPVSDAQVSIGPVGLMPSTDVAMGSSSGAGLYDTEELAGGSYLFRAVQRGFAPLAGKLDIPPVPERWNRRDPPVVLELQDQIVTAGNLPQMKALILWQKNYRAETVRAHPVMPSRGEKNYHRIKPGAAAPQAP